MSSTEGSAALPPRREYLLTPEEFKEFVAACNPPVLFVAGDEHAHKRRAQEMAREFWKRLGGQYGFHWASAEPVPGKEHWGYFTAVPLSQTQPEGEQ